MISFITGPADSGTRAAERVARTITLVLAAAAVVVGVTSTRAITEADRYLAPWYTPLAVAVIFGGLLVVAIVTLRAPLRVIRIAHGVYAIAFVVVQLLWLGAMESPLPESMGPWVLEMTAIGAVPAAIAWRPAVAWAYLLLCSVLVAPIRFFATGGVDWTNPLQYALLTIPLAGLFTALATAALRNTARVDAATVELRQTATRSAAALARAQEQARLDALVHDEVMSTLYYASRGEAELDASVRRQAVGALAQLERLRDGAVESDPGVSAEEFVSRIRSGVLAHSPSVRFTSTVKRNALVPAEVTAAFAEATSEATRNSLSHARNATERSVSVTVTPRRITVSVSDNGPGFDPRDVPPHRLGISVSIRRRMAALADGRADITGGPGSGTVVTLDWREP